jgi:type VI secretion system protein ImpK
VINDDEEGGSFDKTVIGPSKQGSAPPSGPGGGALLSEPTVLLAGRRHARPASGQETVIVARRANTEKLPPEGAGDGAAIDQLFPDPVPAGPNPVLAAAYPILVATTRLRRGWQAGQLSELRDGFAQAVETAASALKHSGLPENDIRRTKLILCELIDETMSDPETGADFRAGTGMMPTFFQTRYTGTGFFEALNELLAEPQTNRNVLEFMHACLCLGFMGQYRRMREADLDRIRSDLRDTLRALRPDQERWLTQPAAAQEERSSGGWISSLVLPVGATIAAGAIYLGLGVVLDREASSVAARLETFNYPAMSIEDSAIETLEGNRIHDDLN